MAIDHSDAVEASSVSLLGRVLANGDGAMPPEVARYVLTLTFSEADKARMHDLAVRNGDGTISPAERDEMFAYAYAGTELGILKAKARRALKGEPTKRRTA